MNNPSILTNIHECIALPLSCKEVGVVNGKYGYYHYLVDGVNDKGWGCGYRSLQTLCSWVCYALGDQSKNRTHAVPTLREIQQILVTLEDKPSSFLGSKEWIGTYEVFLVMDHLYDVSSKILHVESGSKVAEKAKEILNHFVKFGSPVMIGGDNDASSKTLLGVCCTEQGEYYFLIADPHFVGKANIDVLTKNGWLEWKRLEDVFIEGSFYNFCLPQLRSS
ncbi:ufm1-specific protease 2-like [Actinia tenebrosa]|uniref:Ufm1-specific protease 2-like n=1 Tax=Actinia tenebrosa TaxID=6105 RepID=A0A6P8JAP6_ACTTE|nr:ufm1-specific protease 2-like [Actinia tenebrosa]